MFTFPIAFFSSSGSTPPAEAFENYYSNEFDGVDDAIVMTDSGIVSTDFQGLGNNNDYSCSAWIKTSASTGGGSGYWFPEDTIVEIRSESSTATHCPFSFGVTANKLWLGRTDNHITGSENVASVSTVNDGNWHHVAFTVDDDAWVLYIDGSSNASGTFSTATGDCSVGTTTSNFVIGARTTNTGGISSVFDGEIDEVAIFDSALSASDVTTIYNSGSPDSLASQSNLKGWWRMGDGANYPIIKNQAHFSQTATYYDGGSNYVTDIDFSDFAGASNLSISVWAQYQGGNRLMLGTVGSLSHTVMINPWGNSLYWQIRNGGTTYSYFDFSGLMSVGDWFHLVCTFDGTQSSNADKMKMYFNGQQKTLTFVGTMPSTISSSIGNLELGRQSSYGTSNWFLGKLDDISIYNTTLTSSDATDIYNSGYPKDESERSGLVSYYKFDGDTYPVVQDALQFSNASLDFDGSNDYVDCGNPSELQITGAITVSAWVKIPPTGSNSTLISKEGWPVSGGFIRGWNFWAEEASEPRFVIWNGSTAYTSGSGGGNIDDDSWHHLMGVFIPSTSVSVYVDGVLNSQNTTSIPASMNNTTANITIGRFTASVGHFLYGNVSDVAIWDSDQTSNLSTIYNSGKPADLTSLSPTAYWRMGDNTISPNVPSALGYGTHSLSFDGADDYVDLGDSNTFSFGDGSTDTPFSISAWIYRDGTTNDGIVAKDASSNREWAFYIYSGTLRMVLFDNSSGGYIGRRYGSTITNGEWHHVAATYDGGGAASDIKLYLNGTQVDNQDNSSGSYTAMENLGAEVRIGSKESDPLYFDGKIKQVGIFNTELSSSDVTALYNSGLPKDISSESGLVSYYRMGDGEDKYPNILDYKGTAHGTMTNMASDDITTANVGSGTMTNMASDDIVADSPSGTSGQMTNMASDDFVAAKDAGTMTNMTAEDIVADVPKAFVDVDFLVVAGGGAGGQANVLGHVAGGGGGAGGLRTSYGSNSGGGSSAESAFSAEIGTSYTVTVGAGGAAQSSSSEFVGNPGNNSVFATITSIGGGGGGGNNLNATTGGSGGGGSESDGAGAAGTANQGYAGGTGSESGNRGGGGGGAGAVGGTTDGGVGLSVSITGSAVFYAGGGASSGTGGNGGGGNNRTDGTPNTGGGGGSDQTDNPDAVGAGGSGIVILRYPNTRTITVGSGLTSSTTTDGSDKVTTFTAGTDTVSFS